MKQLIVLSSALVLFTFSAVADKSGDLSPELQKALMADSVSEDLQRIVVLCANACEPKSGQKGPPPQIGAGASGKGKRMTKPEIIAEKASKGGTGASNIEGARKNLQLGNHAKPEQTGHDTGMAIIRKMGNRMACTGADACVRMIARDNMCKAKTVKCTSKGCKCKAATKVRKTMQELKG